MQQQKYYLKAEVINKFLTSSDDKLETLIMVSGLELLTTDQALYEAMASVEDRKKIDLNKLVKLLEVTQIVSHQNSTGTKRTILTPEKATEIRKKAQ